MNNNKPADDKETVMEGQTPDAVSESQSTIPPVSEQPRTQWDRFVKRMQDSAAIGALREKPAAEIRRNPINDLDIAIGKYLGGDDGANFKYWCCDPKTGEVLPDRLLDKLKIVLNDIRRICDSQDMAVYLFPDAILNLKFEYCEILRGLAAEYGIEDKFMAHAKKLGVPDKRPVIFMSAPMPAPSRPVAETLPFGQKADSPQAEGRSNEKQRRHTMPMNVAGQPADIKDPRPKIVAPSTTSTTDGKGDKPQRRDTGMYVFKDDEKVQAVQPAASPKIAVAMPSPVPTAISDRPKRTTVQMASAADRVQVSGDDTVIDYEMQKPTDEEVAAVSIRLGHMADYPMKPAEITPIDFSALPHSLFREMDEIAQRELSSISTGVDVGGVDLDGLDYDDLEDTVRMSEPPKSRHRSSFNPPPVSSISFPPEKDSGMDAQKNVADRQYREAFLNRYRTLCFEKGHHDNSPVNPELVGIASQLALKDLREDTEAYGDFNNYYFILVGEEKRAKDLKELSDYLAQKVPSFLTDAKAEFNQVFIPTFLARFNRKKNTDQDADAGATTDHPESKTKKKQSASNHFTRHFEAAMKSTNRKLRDAENKNSANFRLCYPDAVKNIFQYISANLAMATAESEAQKLKDRLRNVVVKMLQFETRREAIAEMSDKDLEQYIEKTKEAFVKWLYDLLPNETGDRPWLLFFFKDKDKEGKVLAEAELGEEVRKVIEDFCQGIINAGGQESEPVDAAVESAFAGIFEREVVAESAEDATGEAPVAAAEEVTAVTANAVAAVEPVKPAEGFTPGDEIPDTLRAGDLMDMTAETQVTADVSGDAPIAEPVVEVPRQVIQTTVGPDKHAESRRFDLAVGILENMGFPRRGSEGSIPPPPPASVPVSAPVEKPAAQVLSSLSKTVILDPDINAETKESAYKKPVLGSLDEKDLLENGWVDVGKWRIVRTQSGGLEYTHEDGHKMYEARPSSRRLPTTVVAAPQKVAPVKAGAGLPKTSALPVTPEEAAAAAAGAVLTAYAAARKSALPVTPEEAAAAAAGAILTASAAAGKSALPVTPKEAAAFAARAILTASAVVKSASTEAPVQQPVHSADTPYRVAGQVTQDAPVHREMTAAPDDLKIPLKKSWFGRIATAVSAAAAIAAAAVGANYLATRTNTNDMQSGTYSTATATPARQTAGVKIATPAPKTTATSTVDSQVPNTTPDIAPDKQVPDNTPETSKEYKVPESLINAVTDSDLKTILAMGKFTAEGAKGGTAEQTINKLYRLVSDLQASGEITAQDAAGFRKSIKQKAETVNVGQAGNEFKYYDAKTDAERNEIRSNPSNPDHNEFVRLETVWGDFTTWRSKFGNLSEHVQGGEEGLAQFEAYYVNFEAGIMAQNSGNNIDFVRAGDQIRPGFINVFSDTVREIELKLAAKDKASDITPENDFEDLKPAPQKAPGSAAPAVDAGAQDNATDAGTPTNIAPDSGKTGMLMHDDSPEIIVTGQTESDDDQEIEVTWEEDDTPDIEVTLADYDDSGEIEVDVSEYDDSAEIDVSLEDDNDSPDIEVTVADYNDTPEIKVTDASREKAIADAKAVRANIDEAVKDISWDLPPRKAAVAPVVKSTFDKRAENIAHAKAVRAKIDEAVEDISWEPTLEQKIKNITAGGFESRRKALVDRGEVFIPSLKADPGASVMQVIINGLMMACDTEEQENKMALLLNRLSEKDMAEYRNNEADANATLKGTYAKITPEFHNAAKEILKGKNVTGVKELVRRDIAAATAEVLKAA